MATILILSAMAIGMILVEVVPRVFWLDEDWRHLRLADSWDASKSRGRVNHRADW
jgi:hypothetical protein